MKNNSINTVKIIYLGATLILFVAFMIFVLEKAQIINLYTKPVSETPRTTSPVNDVDYSPASPTDNEEINTKKTNPEKIESNEAPEPKPGDPISVVLTAATQDTVGGPVVVRVLLTDTKAGVCNISMNKGANSVKYTKKVVNAGTYYNCETLDIPIADIKAGTWVLNVQVNNGDRTGSASQQVEVKI